LDAFKELLRKVVAPLMKSELHLDISRVDRPDYLVCSIVTTEEITQLWADSDKLNWEAPMNVAGPFIHRVYLSDDRRAKRGFETPNMDFVSKVSEQVFTITAC
jgi:hypothetical protein